MHLSPQQRSPPALPAAQSPGFLRAGSDADHGDPSALPCHEVVLHDSRIENEEDPWPVVGGDAVT